MAQNPKAKGMEQKSATSPVPGPLSLPAGDLVTGLLCILPEVLYTYPALFPLLTHLLSASGFFH